MSPHSEWDISECSPWHLTSKVPRHQKRKKYPDIKKMWRHKKKCADNVRRITFFDAFWHIFLMSSYFFSRFWLEKCDDFRHMSSHVTKKSGRETGPQYRGDGKTFSRSIKLQEKCFLTPTRFLGVLHGEEESTKKNRVKKLLIVSPNPGSGVFFYVFLFETPRKF